MIKTTAFTAALSVACFFGAHNNAMAQTTTATKQLPTYIGELRGFVGEGIGQFRTVPADEIDFSEPTIIGNTFLNEE